MTVCAATNCIVAVQKGHLMCRGHWFEVPPRLRVSIVNSFRSRYSQEYQRSVRTAIEHIEGIENIYSEPFSSAGQFSHEQPKTQEAGYSGSRPPALIIIPHMGTAS